LERPSIEYREGRLREEPKLIAGLRAGELEALGELYRQLGGAMTTLARTLLRDRDEADDVVEDALVRIHASARGFRGERGLRTWALRIVLNLCRDRFRRRRFRGDSPDRLDPLEHAGLRIEPTADWDEALDGTERMAALERAIDRLPPDQRDAVVLCHRLGLSQHEAAELLGVAEGAVKARLFRARAQLRGAMKPWMEERRS
jgi:RNA polymerase sigma-70 factor (ECF subfamily)